MFSFLDMINSSLSYFNLDVKLKNKIYIGIASLGDIYLVYVTFRLFQNHVWWRALLYCLAMVAITYFLYLNFVFYFMNKTSQFDIISPRFAKITGQKFGDSSSAAPLNAQQKLAAELANRSNGVFSSTDTIPAVVAIDEHEQENLHKVVDRLLMEGIFVNDYDGLDERQIVEQNRATDKPVTALNSQSVPPYFELVHDGLRHRLEIYIGMNQMERRAVGHITKIGLTDVHTAHDKYRLYLASVLVNGGPNKIAGRSGSTIMTDADYGLQVQVAYKPRTETEN
jgi:hypothetical protein